MVELTIRAEPAEFRRASLWLEQICMELCVPAEQLSRLDLCLNEVLANILSHGGETALSEPIFLHFKLSRNLSVCVASLNISDAGVKFDPMTAAVKPRRQSLAEAEPGSLGLLMLFKFSDNLSYCYRDGRNHLNCSVNWIDTH